MSLQLTAKEKTLLQDQKKHEQVCIEKYRHYAAEAQDPTLKQLFNSYAQQEEQHLSTITQMLNGQLPGSTAMQEQQSQTAAPSSNAAGSSMSSSAGSNARQTNASQTDAALCQDMLMTEKYVSGAYDTAIFEFTNTQLRQELNHIQKEEQQHGEGIYRYMQNNGMY